MEQNIELALPHHIYWLSSEYPGKKQRKVADECHLDEGPVSLLAERGSGRESPGAITFKRPRVELDQTD